MGSGWSVRANRQMSRLLGGIVGGGYIYIYKYEMQGIVQTFGFSLGEISLKQIWSKMNILTKNQKPTAKSIDHDKHFAMIPFIYKVGPY